MRIRHYAEGRFYTIDCPEGTEVVRLAGPDDHLVVPLRGQAIRIPADPPGLLPLLAESGNFGVSLAGEPVPDVWLAGSICPRCGEVDVAWLQVRDDPGTIHCDSCGAGFALTAPPGNRVGSSRRAGGG